jgi:hypothetical protein
MQNIDFLKDIITTEHEYWVIAKRNTAQEYGRSVRIKDSIYLIDIPYDLKRGVPEDEILLKDLETIRSSCFDQNISISEPYAPFQRCMCFYDVYKGFPILGDVKKFLIKALELGSDEIYNYHEMSKIQEDSQLIAQ